MADLLWYQYALIGITFIWSGFVRSGLGFGGAVLSLPFLLLIAELPQAYLALIAVHLMVFSSITVYKNLRAAKKTTPEGLVPASTVDWAYLKFALLVMIVPKMIGVFGLLTLPSDLMSNIIFGIVLVYALSYIFDRPFRSNNKVLDIAFLMLGGYVSGTSLIGAPLIIAVFATHVAKEQLRDTLFTLWFILVFIKMTAFVYAGVDLQLIHHLWLLPCAAIGHFIGLRFHQKLLQADSRQFFRVLGSVLLVISVIGIYQA
jgi:uncharacterized membrane protein YfcA